MKLRTICALTIMGLSAALSLPAQAQQSTFRRVPSQDRGQDRFQDRDRARAPRPQDVPSTPILPMTNPIAPITTAPVQPFIRYGGVIPEVVIPSNEPRRPGTERGRRNRDVPIVVIGGGYYPYGYYPYYPEPYLSPGPIPGQLPNTYPVQQPYAPVQQPYALESPYAQPVEPVPAAVPHAPPVYEPEYVPERNMIITPPQPERTVEPPAIGTSRADLLARYGEPWGSVRIQGKETLYFNGGLQVVLENDRVTQVR